MALAKSELESAVMAGCQIPNCNHDDHSTIYLRSRCHPRGGIDVYYKQGTGKLTVACRACNEVVVEIAVQDDTVRTRDVNPELLEACRKGLAYDAAIQKRAKDGKVELRADGSGIAEGDDLDALYVAWIDAMRDAVARVQK